MGAKHGEPGTVYFGSNCYADWFTIDGGGWLWSSGDKWHVAGAIGQPEADPDGPSTGGGFVFTAGFWTGTRVAADFDGDGDVDEEDHAAFEGCLEGPEGTLGTECQSMDLDDDEDVDLRDFAFFQAFYSG